MPFQFYLAKKVQRENKESHVLQSKSAKIPSQKKASEGDAGRVNPWLDSPRLPGFKEKIQYEVILEWDLAAINKKFKYQRFGIKSWTSFEKAVQDITQFVSMLNSVSSDKGSRGIQVVRIVGIYEATVFKDWSNDPYNLLDGKAQKAHIEQALALIGRKSTGKKQKPVSFVKEIDMKVR